LRRQGIPVFRETQLETAAALLARLEERSVS
jgi:hypothetical protein